MLCSHPTESGRVAKALSGGIILVLSLVVAGAPVHAQGDPARQAGTPQSPRPEVYFEFQVEKPVQPLPGGATPRYPAALRAAQTQGEVIAQFVVDTAGVPDMRSFKILRSQHADFTASVRDVVPQMRFRPAELGGRMVYQLVQMPFVFRLDRGATTTIEVTTRAPEVPAQASPHAQQAMPVPTAADSAIYDEREVDTKVAPASGNRPPKYPEELRSESVRGEVLVQLVVADDGTVMPGSIRILRSTHGQFVAAVRQVLPGYRFIPATRQGRPVHARVQMPFLFSLDRGAASPTLRRRPGGE